MTLENLDDWIMAVALAAPSMPRIVAVSVGILLWAGPAEVGVETFLVIGDAFAAAAQHKRIYGQHEQANELAKVARLVRTRAETTPAG